MQDFNFEELHENLFSLQDVSYKNFQMKLLPTVDGEKIIGVRSPGLCKFAKDFFKDKNTDAFLKNLPHKYFEENSIHVLMISEIKNFHECLQAVKKFLPYIDNWAVCDSLIPKIFAKHIGELEGEIKNWLHSDSTYTVRFALLMLMKFYLDENFDRKYLQWAAEIKSDEYYIKMMSAWYFAESLVKQYESAIIFLERNLLSPNVHRKTIQKAVESRRISADRKKYLKSLRISRKKSEEE